MRNGAVKLGQPVPLSNFVAGREQRQAAQPAAVDAGLLVAQQRAAEGRLGAVAEQHMALLAGQTPPRAPCAARAWVGSGRTVGGMGRSPPWSAGLEQIAMGVAQLRHLGGGDHADIGLVWVPGGIVVMIVLGLVERLQRLQRGLDRRVEQLRRVDLGDVGRGDLALPLALEEDRRAVLPADIRHPGGLSPSGRGRSRRTA